MYKETGIDQLINNILAKIKELETAYLAGKLAQGIKSQIFDVILVGEDFNKKQITRLCDKFEKSNHRKIRYLTLHPDEKKEILKETNAFMIWGKE